MSDFANTLHLPATVAPRPAPAASLASSSTSSPSLPACCSMNDPDPAAHCWFRP